MLALPLIWVLSHGPIRLVLTWGCDIFNYFRGHELFVLRFMISTVAGKNLRVQ